MQTEGRLDGLLKKAGKNDLVVVDFEVPHVCGLQDDCPSFRRAFQRVSRLVLRQRGCGLLVLTASGDEVMSMPTFILFKNGKL